MSMTQKMGLIVGLVLTGFLMYLLSPILTPFIVAGLIAYLGDPLIHRLEQLKIPRALAVIFVFVILIALFLILLFLLIPTLGRQLSLLLQKVPDILAWFQQVALPWVNKEFDISLTLDLAGVKDLLAEHWQQAGNVAGTVWHTLAHSGHTVLAWLLNLVLIPVVTFYLLRDWRNVIQGAKQLLPRSVEPIATRLLNECNEVLGAFFRGQFIVMLALGTFYAAGLGWVGVPLALLIGILAGILSIVPYLGTILGVLVASIVTLMQFHDAQHLLYVAIVFVVGQILEGMVLTPWLVGDRIGLHPVVVIFAILAGGQLFGFFGVLLALPVAAVLMVLVRHLKLRYMGSALYHAKKNEY
jgi:predicted PurR-regulated permease PerM